LTSRRCFLPRRPARQAGPRRRRRRRTLPGLRRFVPGATTRPTTAAPGGPRSPGTAPAVPAAAIAVTVRVRASVGSVLVYEPSSSASSPPTSSPRRPVRLLPRSRPRHRGHRRRRRRGAVGPARRRRLQPGLCPRRRAAPGRPRPPRRLRSVLARGPPVCGPSSVSGSARAKGIRAAAVGLSRTRAHGLARRLRPRPVLPGCPALRSLQRLPPVTLPSPDGGQPLSARPMADRTASDTDTLSCIRMAGNGSYRGSGWDEAGHRTHDARHGDLTG
jgi:hypothetical protein